MTEERKTTILGWCIVILLAAKAADLLYQQHDCTRRGGAPVSNGLFGVSCIARGPQP